MTRIYVDTSVIGGCSDPEFELWSKRLMNEFRDGLKVAIISDLTLQELEDAPLHVRELMLEIPAAYREYVFLSEEARLLAKYYISEKAAATKFLIDAQHIAMATISHADVLVSWNFRHIVNLNKIRSYNAVNLRHGYCLLEIRSPREVVNES